MSARQSSKNAPDPELVEPTDALVQVTRACVCGSDLHPYHSAHEQPGGIGIGHELISVITDVGPQVETLTKGDFVIAPFVISRGVCEFCRDGMQTSCVNGGFWNDANLGTAGCQAEAVRVPRADGTLAKVLDAVGHLPACEQAVGIVRPGGVISRVGVPQHHNGPIGWSLFGKNTTLTGGPAPVRAYIGQLLPAVLDGTITPGKVFDRTVSIEDTPKGYAAMDARESLKVMIRP